MTPEDQITYAMLYLEQTNQVVDDWQGKGLLSYQLGAYRLAFGDIPCAGWSRDFSQAYLGWSNPGFPDLACGVRSRVRLR